MFQPDLVIDTKTYSLTAQRATSSVRSDASQPLGSPNLLTISHESAKNGRRNSVVILDDTVSVLNGTTLSTDNIKVLFKISYNPFSGRATITEDLIALRNALKAFISDDALFTKFLNGES